MKRIMLVLVVCCLGGCMIEPIGYIPPPPHHPHVRPMILPMPMPIRRM